LPVPVAPKVIVIQEALEVTVRVQFCPLTTVMVTVRELPPSAGA
jgi:hypothetical protein